MMEEMSPNAKIVVNDALGKVGGRLSHELASTSLRQEDAISFH